MKNLHKGEFCTFYDLVRVKPNSKWPFRPVIFMFHIFFFSGLLPFAFDVLSRAELFHFYILVNVLLSVMIFLIFYFLLIFWSFDTFLMLPNTLLFRTVKDKFKPLLIPEHFVLIPVAVYLVYAVLCLFFSDLSLPLFFINAEDIVTLKQHNLLLNVHRVSFVEAVIGFFIFIVFTPYLYAFLIYAFSKFIHLSEEDDKWVKKIAFNLNLQKNIALKSQMSEIVKSQVSSNTPYQDIFESLLLLQNRSTTSKESSSSCL